jgi:hypothetical protein
MEPEDFHRVHNSPSQDHIMSQLNSTSTFYFFMIHLNNILSSMHRFPRRSLIQFLQFFRLTSVRISFSFLLQVLLIIHSNNASR